MISLRFALLPLLAALAVEAIYPVRASSDDTPTPRHETVEEHWTHGKLRERKQVLRLEDGTMVDDAYITVRYAQNLIDEGALVYNPGQRALGVTGPLYPVWVAVLLLLAHAKHIGHAVGLANTAFFAVTAVWLFHLVREIGAKTAVLAVLLFAVI